ncbi:hypothetical protein HYD53_02785 [Mycoplasmopsis bovis]|nr:hypothetical protein HYD53_02785 [Mycoplasmopsis bovis]
MQIKRQKSKIISYFNAPIFIIKMLALKMLQTFKNIHSKGTSIDKYVGQTSKTNS